MVYQYLILRLAVMSVKPMPLPGIDARQSLRTRLAPASSLIACLFILDFIPGC